MSTKNSTYLIGLAAAAAAGAALGLLLAPKKGSDTRKDIQDKVDEISDQVKRMSKKAKSHISNIQDDLYDIHSQAKSTVNS
jgi:gas vesicle protein